MAGPPEAPRVDDETIAALVEVFSRWGELERLEKRRLLREWGMRVQVDRPEYGGLRVVRLDIAGCNLEGLYRPT